MAAQEKQKIVICGAGNAAHIFCGLCSANSSNEVHLLSLYSTEAADFQKALNKTKDKLLTLDIKAENKTIKSRPVNITNDARCLSGTDIIIISLPAFAHGQYIQAIKRHVKPKDNKKVLVSFWPGGAGLECQWHSIIGKSSDFVLSSSRTLPWAARIVQFGSRAEILGTKEKIEVSIYIPKDNDRNGNDKIYVNKMQNLIGKLPLIINTGHIFNMSLSVVGSIVHPSIMYAKWSKYDGKPLTYKPLFYQGITENDAKLMTQLSDEIILIIEAIEKETGLKLFKQKIYDWFIDAYGKKAGDKSSLYKIITTNPGYQGLQHPMLKPDDNKDEYFPNYKYRYLTQDIPMGLGVIRGFSLILDQNKYQVNVPLIDNILKWAQKALNKEYFIYNNDGTVVAGKDIKDTRCPQKFGITSINDLI